MHLRIYHIGLLFYALGFASPVIQAQADRMDSLKQVISRQDESIDKVDNLIELSKIYDEIDKDSAMMFAEQAHALSLTLGYRHGQLNAMFRTGYLKKMKYEPDTAFKIFSELLELSEKFVDSINMARSSFQFGSYYRTKLKTRLAIFYYKKSLRLYRALKDTAGMYSNYNGIGIAYKNYSQYDSALIYYLKAVNLIIALNKFDKLSIAYHNVGSIYRDLKDYANARKYLHMALDYTDQSRPGKTLGIIYSKLGNVYNEEIKLDTALEYYKMAEDVFQKLNYARGIHDLYVNYGDIFVQKGLYNLALNNFNLALTYYRKENIPDGIISAWKNIAKYHIRKDNYFLALQMMDSCVNQAIKTGLLLQQLEALNFMAEISYAASRYKDSYNYYKRYEAVKDSIYALEKEEIVSTLRIKFERDLDRAIITGLENENLSLENENLRKTKQRNVYLFTGIGIIAFSLFLLFYIRQTARKNRIIAEQKIRQLEEEKKLLAARFLVEGQEEERKRIATELHDGLGVLLSATKMQFSSIKDTKPENKPLIEKATKFLEQASSDVRKISHNMMPGLLTKLGLCEALEDLFEQLDETEGVTATCEIKGARERLPENKEIMIYRIVQEMVNNTIKHAEAKKIELRIDVMPGKLDIRYADDGKGFNVEEMIEKKSIGLQSIKSRVKFLDGTVSIESEAGKGTVYAMQIPVNTEH